MSLTSHLDDSSSPIGTFLRSRFSHTASIAKVANPYLKRAQQVPPSSRQSYPYGLIGTAVDYRLRYYFAVTHANDLVASAGAAKLIRRVPQYTAQLMECFFADLSDALNELRPVGRLLEGNAEILLARFCFVLALFETVKRSAKIPETLLLPHVKTTVKDLLAAADDNWIEDISAVSRLFYRTQSSLLKEPFILNPTFAGSADVGGADADLIVNGCLLEIKTSTQDALDSAWLRQLAGYALLDYKDEYAIQSVGIYMARHGVLLNWPLDEYMRLLTGDESVSMTSLRQELHSAVEQYGVVRSERIAAAERESLAELALMERADQMSQEGLCIRCGGPLSFTEDRAVESVTKRGRIRLTDIVTVSCTHCDIKSTSYFNHPKSPRTDLDKLAQSRRTGHIFSFNRVIATWEPRFNSDVSSQSD